NYLIYAAGSSAAGQACVPFAEYRGSPVPHANQRRVITILMLILISISMTVFFFVRRYSLRHPEVLDNIVANRKEFETREEKTAWEEVGFHRPMGGFLIALLFGLILFVPFAVFNMIIMPQFVLPSAQAMGIWNRVLQFFMVFFLFFDWGTSTAFVKFMSQYRVTDPRKGAKFGQLYVWWQAISGMIQALVFVIVASYWAPQTAYAVYAWAVIANTLIQVPGFYQVFRYSLAGMQRYDYAQIVDLMGNTVLPMILQPVIVILFYRYGVSNPVLGGSMGGVIGMGIAAYAIQLFNFFISLGLYKRMGYSAKIYFFAHFDREVVKQALSFGMFEMLGSIAWAAGQAIEIWITQTKLINYAEIWGNWAMAMNFTGVFWVLNTLYGYMMPSVSEAVSSGCGKLAQYYEVQSYKWGGFIGAFMTAVLLSIAPKFIIGASGPEFQRAAIYIIPLAIFGFFQYGSWVGDNIALASNKPWLKPIMVIAEQIIRLGGAWLFIAKLQVYALIIFYLAALVAKGIAFYFINDRVCFKHAFYFWQSLAAPILAGAAHFAVLSGLACLIWSPNMVSSGVLFLVGILLSFPVYIIFFSFFGGWDDGSLDELRMGADNSSFMKWFAVAVWKLSSLAARISPLHNRFPITIRDEALAEAGMLTQRKVRL
ncbi:MAG: lipopolysaccharide biosynthesis protein, partial [Spirochaetota bacterium]